MKFFKSIREALDIYKTPINVFFFSKERISTNFNMCLSIIFFVILLANLSQSDFFKKRHPQITDQTFGASKISLKLNKENFGLNLWFFDNSTYYNEIDPSYFTFELFEMSLDGLKEEYIEKKPFTLEPCTQVELESAFCVGNDSNIYLNLTEKSWLGEYSYLKLSVVLCQNETYNNQCKTIDQIYEFLQGKKFALGFNQYLIDMRNYESPSKIDAQTTIEFSLNKNMRQCSSLYLMEVELYSSENLFFDTEEQLIQKFYQKTAYFDYSFEIIDSNEDLDLINHELFVYYLYPTRNKRKITRKYTTLLEAFSNLGGLASFLNIFCVILSRFSIKVKIFQKLAKNIDKLKEEEQNNGEKQSIASEHKRIAIKDLSYNNSVEMSLRNKNDIELENNIDKKNCIQIPTKNKSHETSKDELKDIAFEIEHIKSKKNKISFWSMIKYYFRKIFKMKLYHNDFIIENIQRNHISKFDFEVLMKIINDVEKLKLIILTEIETKIFDSITYISDENKKKYGEMNNNLTQNYEQINRNKCFWIIKERLKLLFNIVFKN